MSRSSNTAPARMSGAPEDYSTLGIEPHAIKPWEDALRTEGSAGTYEWWYFDAHLDDGAKLVVVFFTKEFTDIDRPLAPAIRLELTLPDGTQEGGLVRLDPATFSASTDACDIRIGDNVFAGDLHAYTIRARVEGVSVDVTLTGQVPPGRPKTDKLDAVWLSKLAERGMVRASSVPPKPVRQLRDFTRTRTVFVQEHTRHKHRVDKAVQDA